MIELTRRELATAVTAGATLSGGCASSKSDDSSSSLSVAGRWPSLGYEATNNRSRPSGGVPATVVRPQWQTRVSQEVSSCPTLGRQSAFVTSVDDGVVAVDRITGETVWERNDLTTVSSTPALDGDRLYLGTVDGVVALQRTKGATVWRRELGASHAASPTVLDGTVYIGSGQSVYALDSASGTVEWSFPTGGLIGTAPAVDDKAVYVTSADDSIHSVARSDGSENWATAVEDGISCSPVLRAKTVVTAGLDGVLYGVNRQDGTVRRTTEVGPVFAGIASHDNQILVSSMTGLHSVRPRVGGYEHDWQFTPGSLGFRSAPAIVGETVYAGHENGSVYAVSLTDGSEQWRYDTETATVRSAPAVAGGGVYVGDNDGFVHALSGV